MMGFACSIEWHATDLINIHNAGRQAGASVQLKSAWTSPTRPELKSPNQTQSDRRRQMQTTTTTTAKISWITSIFYFYSYNIFFSIGRSWWLGAQQKTPETTTSALDCWISWKRPKVYKPNENLINFDRVISVGGSGIVSGFQKRTTWNKWKKCEFQSR